MDTNLHDIFTTAIEGGINYWASLVMVDHDEDNWYARVLDRDAETGFLHVIDKATIREGIRNLAKSEYTHHLDDLVEDNMDATTADVIVQMALFGDIVYG